MGKLGKKDTHKDMTWVPPVRPKGKPFTVVEINALKPGPRPYRQYGRDGLIVEVHPSGAKRWRWRYRRPGGTETMVSLGTYPEITLAEANARLATARRDRAMGGDPVEKKQKAKAELANSFATVARDWLATRGAGLKDRTNKQRADDLERLILPGLGEMPIGTINAKNARPVFEAIIARGKVHTAHRMLSHCMSIADFAIAGDLIELNPFPPLRGLLPREVVKHQAAITKAEDFAKLLRDIDAYSGAIEVRLALRFAPLVFLRPSELGSLRWEDVDWKRREVLSRKGERKEKRDLVIPLADQSFAILREMQPITGGGPYIFGLRLGHKIMSSGTLNMAVRRLGYSKEQHTAHGFRSSARTLIDQELRVPADVIELQLGHTIPGHLGGTYNRVDRIEARHEMMQRWGHYLSELKNVP
jgi:integrase